MKLDDLKTTWKQRQIELADHRVDQLVQNAASRSSWFEKTIKRRDLGEFVALAVVFLLFLPDLFSAESWVTRIGVMVILAGSIFIGFVLYWSGRGKLSCNDQSVMNFCKEQLKRVNRQIWLLRNIAWWYIAPLLVGCCIYVHGLLPGNILTWIICGFFVALGLFIYWLNQLAVQKRLIPLREEFVGMLMELESMGNGEDIKIGESDDSSETGEG